MTLIIGPCVIESRDLLHEVAGSLADQLKGLPLDLYFKASFEKANRSSGDSFRGPGLEKGLELLAQVKKTFGFKLLTDVHEVEQVEPAAGVVDFLQIPAFLCRQTSLIEATARASRDHGCRVNVKKGQFLAPWDVDNIVDKFRRVAGEVKGLAITERGVSFGYNALVVDMVSFQYIRRTGAEAIYDVTHSIQSPGGGAGGKTTGGRREHLESLARAAMAAGAQGVFMECHPRPQEAKSDGPNAFYLSQVGDFVRQLLKIREWVADLPYLLPEAKPFV